MLHLTLSEGDYMMIGENIRVYYHHNNGKFSLTLGIEAPRDVSVLRGTLYEEGIANKAAAGDKEAMELLEQITAEKLDRRRASGKRKAKRQFHGGRLAREAREQATG
jgi:sRNA-binding carbon storage regulator CsrA